MSNKLEDECTALQEIRWKKKLKCIMMDELKKKKKCSEIIKKKQNYIDNKK